MRKTHRMIALLCVLCMLFSCMPVSVLSDGTQPATQTDLRPEKPKADLELAFKDDLKAFGDLEGENPKDYLIRFTPEITQTMVILLSSDKELTATVTDEEADTTKKLTEYKREEDGKIIQILPFYKVKEDQTYLIRISGLEPGRFRIRLVRKTILDAEEEAQQEEEDEPGEEPGEENPDELWEEEPGEQPGDENPDEPGEEPGEENPDELWEEEPGEQPGDDNPDEPGEEEPADEPGEEEPGEQPGDENPDEPGEEEPGEEPGEDEPGEQPGDENPDEPGEEEPADEPGEEEPGEQPGDENPDEPGEEEPGDEPGEDEPGEQPGDENPDEPGEEEPADEPGEEEPGEQPGDENPDEPGEDEPGEEPGEEEPGEQPGEEDPDEPGEEEPEVPVEVQLSAETLTVKATAMFLSDAGIPEDAELQIRELEDADRIAVTSGTAQALNCADESYLLYTKYLEISFRKDGEVFLPKGPVLYCLELREETDSTQTLQMVYIREQAEQIDCETEDGAILFRTEEVGTFGIINALQPLSTQETELVSVELLGLSPDTRADLTEAEAPEFEEGLEVLGTFVIEELSGADPEGEEQSGLWIKAELNDAVELAPMEGVALYRVEDGRADILAEDLSGESVLMELDAQQIAVVKDTGYRHLTVTVNPDRSDEEKAVTLDGMMPKTAEVSVVDVTNLYADFYSAEAEEKAPDAMNRKTVSGMNSAADSNSDTNTTEQDNGTRTPLAVFDISISDGFDDYQPDEDHPITVEIVDSRITTDKTLELWHIRDNGTEDQVKEFTIEEGTIKFIAYGFSAYAIVTIDDAGAPLPDSHIVENLEYLKTHGEDGFLISFATYYWQETGYYFLTTDNNNLSIGQTTRYGFRGTTTPVLANVSPGPANGKFYFRYKTEEDKFIVYIKEDNQEKYVQGYVANESRGRGGLKLTTDISQATLFIIAEGIDNDPNTSCHGNNFDNHFYIGTTDGYYWNRNEKSDGTGYVVTYKNSNDKNLACMRLHYSDSGSGPSDPYGLDNLAYGLMFWNGGVAGKALMAGSTNAGTLDAKAMEVLVKSDDTTDKLFVPRDSEITDWTFHWVEDDLYHLSAAVNGTTKYLKVDSTGLSLADTETEASSIQLIPGSGAHTGQISLKAGDTTLTFSGKVETGFNTGGSAGNEWLYLVQYSELTSEYLVTYSASKISVSDEALTNGSRIIVYTRVWNQSKMRYDFYAIESDGSLVQCYESGDTIQWIGNRANTKLWDLVEYYYEGTTDPNYYYELYNEYSQQYIAPQVSGGQTLSPNTIGINIDGRKKGHFYSTIMAWDEANYAYVGLKADVLQGKIAACSMGESDDFYFALMQDVELDDDVTYAPTVDNKEHGITMRIKDFDSKNEMNGLLGSSTGGAGTNLVTGLLSTNLVNGYPTIKNKNNTSLGSMYQGATEVNHLFLLGTYNGSGYFTFDSTENFATLRQEDGSIGTNFRVYRELGTWDRKYDGGDDKPSMKHGQFLPYNDLKPGEFATVNGLNLYDAKTNLLSEDNPRKYEKLYIVEHENDPVNLHFAVELEASFVQTPSGQDNWGHDIIYEFTGDDDFWLYVDGELVIDLGGIHSAVPGSVNYHTGAVNNKGTHSTLYDIFKSNYIGRGHTEQEALEYVDGDTYPDTGLFTKNSDGNWVFKDYTTHTMKIFYMERGGGASNLNMRFNLASVKDGHVELSKKLEGVENPDSLMSEFPYQIWYKKTVDLPETLLSKENPQLDIKVFYKDTTIPVKYLPELTVEGITYHSVFMLKPGEVADIEIPDNAILYKIIECGINSDIYHYEVTAGNETKDITVEVNEGKETVYNGQIYSDDYSYPTNRKDYYIDYAETRSRTRAAFVNRVNPEAMRTLSIEKHLYDVDGTTELYFDDDNLNAQDLTTFGFRLYLASELDNGLSLADKYTYHVLNRNKVYCRWDTERQRFVPLESGKTDYAQLTADEKKAASFNTSMNGSISKIPASYTVEVRELLVGTKYQLEERKYEIPDGYSLKNYFIYDDEDDTDYHEIKVAKDYTIQADSDPKVVINNLKGYGLRVYKHWNDADYMTNRAPTYIAVYRGKNQDALTLVPGTVKRLSQNEETLYWYFEALDDGDTNYDFEDYYVREVTIENTGETPNADGVIENPGTVTMIPENGTVSLLGRQRGENNDSMQEYTVHYEQGTPETDKPNIRVDNITNSRRGLVIRKEDWVGDGLGETTFILKDAEYTAGSNLLNATYTSLSSGDVGYVTTAFLRKNATYTLTETKAKHGYLGLQAPLVISVDGNGDISVSSEQTDADFYRLSVDDQTQARTLTIRNKPFTFTVSKVDKDSNQPVEGAVFELHKQITVGGVTMFDFNPLAGYTSLQTDENGTIPKLDQTLPAGTYELREISAPLGYEKWVTGLQFTLNDVGKITLGNRVPDGTVLLEESKTIDNRVVYEYILKVPNSSDSQRPWLKIKKKVTGNLGDTTEEFKFTITMPNVDPGTKFDYQLGDQISELTLDQNSQWTIYLHHGQSVLIARLPLDTPITVTEENGLYSTTWKLNNVDVAEGTHDGVTYAADTNTVSFALANNTTLEATNSLSAVAPTGYSVRNMPYLLMLAGGLLLAAFFGGAGIRKKRRRDNPETVNARGDPGDI